MKQKSPINGVVKIALSKEGRHLGTGICFDPVGSATDSGAQLAQGHAAERDLANNLIDNLSSYILNKALSSGEKYQLMRTMRDKGLITIQEIAVGYDD